jgi:hypothetical protein
MHTQRRDVTHSRCTPLVKVNFKGMTFSDPQFSRGLAKEFYWAK